MNVIDHGYGLKSKWDMRVYGKMPPNPPLEVRFNGTEWEVYQQRSERVLETFGDNEDCIGAAIELATEQATELFVKDESGDVQWSTSYR